MAEIKKELNIPSNNITSPTDMSRKKSKASFAQLETLKNSLVTNPWRDTTVGFTVRESRHFRKSKNISPN